MEQLTGRVITASEGTTILFSVLPGCLHPMGHSVPLWPKGIDLGLVAVKNF